jgi:malate synthase
MNTDELSTKNRDEALNKQQIMDKVIRDLESKKEQVIKDKFAEKGFAHLLENLAKSRFKKVAVEQWSDREEWYADNGTDEGVLIVTFLKPTPQITNNLNNGLQMTAEIKYY